MKRSPLKRTGRLKPVSKRRAAANAEYSVRRKRFLAEHPYCQWMICEAYNIRPHTEEFIEQERWLILNPLYLLTPSDQVHHMKKPKCKYLNDESTWMAVSAEGHRWIEAHKDLARERGYLFNI